MIQMRRIVISLFCVAVLGFAVHLTASYTLSNEIRPHSARQQEWVDRAIILQAGPSERDREALLQTVVPVVIYLPDLVCVAFKLKRSALGGEATVCFSKTDGSVEINHSEGQ